MEKTIILSEIELKGILGKHFKISPKNIIYAGWSGVLSFGKFLITIKDEE